MRFTTALKDSVGKSANRRWWVPWTFKRTLASRVGEAFGPLFENASFAETFPLRGRPAVSPGSLALVSVLQYAEGTQRPAGR
jgi:hypothetical protein